MRVFEETQRFTQWWLIPIYLFLLGFPLFGSYKWFVLNENLGNVGPTDWDGIATIFILFPLLLIVFYFLKLNTVIDERGILYRFSPIHRNSRLVAWKDIEKCYVKQYNPILDYGGWGYKFIGRGKGLAYNVKGNKGIQIEYKNGKKLLIGTQRPEEAQQVIDKYIRNEGI